jgi:hypothetical protein
MFQKFPLILKIGIVCCSTLFALSCAIWIYCFEQARSSILVAALLEFILTWNLIFGAFVFYQTFKYFRLPKRFYRQLPFEKTAFFRRIGVLQFRKILINSFFRHLNPRVYVRKRSRDEFLRLIEETKQAETSHLLSGLVTFIFQILYLFNDHFLSFCLLSFFNLVFNLYPLLLQRCNRFQFLAKLDKFS